MKPTHRLNRRSFLGQVAGGAAGGALALIGGEAGAIQITDHDPTDPSGRGRGGGTGVTDADSGPGADPAGRGRGTNSPRGRGAVAGVTDRDTGPGADPPQRGRGTEFGANGNQWEQRNRNCTETQGRINQLQQEVNQVSPRIRELEVTANWIASDYQQVVQSYGANSREARYRSIDYVNRVRGLGIEVDYNSDPNWIVQQLSNRAGEQRNRIQPMEQEIAQLRNLLAQYNCQ